MIQARTATLRSHMNKREARMAAWALAFAALTGAGALMRIPLFPVPLTMQVFFVLLAGLLLGPRWGAASQLAYLAMGACGAPFFAAPPHAGPAVLFGPTGGYLWGFVAGAYLAGALGHGARGLSAAYSAAAVFPVVFLSCLAGIAAVYLAGTAWLAAWLGSLSAAVRKGVLPFIVSDLCKAAGATAVAAAESFKRRRKRKPGR